MDDDPTDLFSEFAKQNRRTAFISSIVIVALLALFILGNHFCFNPDPRITITRTTSTRRRKFKRNRGKKRLKNKPYKRLRASIPDRTNENVGLLESPPADKSGNNCHLDSVKVTVKPEDYG